jgi:hypothetical protein
VKNHKNANNSTTTEAKEKYAQIQSPENLIKIQCMLGLIIKQSNFGQRFPVKAKLSFG